MFTSVKTTERVKLKEGIPHAFEKDVLRYTGSRRYVATWWSEDFQSLVCADGEIWRVGDVGCMKIHTKSTSFVNLFNRPPAYTFSIS